jgi:hypothetical protein
LLSFVSFLLLPALVVLTLTRAGGIVLRRAMLERARFQGLINEVRQPRKGPSGWMVGDKPGDRIINLLDCESFL